MPRTLIAPWILEKLLKSPSGVSPKQLTLLYLHQKDPTITHFEALRKISQCLWGLKRNKLAYSSHMPGIPGKLWFLRKEK